MNRDRKRTIFAEPFSTRRQTGRSSIICPQVQLVTALKDREGARLTDPVLLLARADAVIEMTRPMTACGP